MNKILLTLLCATVSLSAIQGASAGKPKPDSDAIDGKTALTVRPQFKRVPQTPTKPNSGARKRIECRAINNEEKGPQVEYPGTPTKPNSGARKRVEFCPHVRTDGDGTHWFRKNNEVKKTNNIKFTLSNGKFYQVFPVGNLAILVPVAPAAHGVYPLRDARTIGQ